MKLARPILAAVTVGIVLAVVFTVFAVELASSQTRSRNEIKTEVQDRAVLTASLINSVFGTVEQNPQQYANYGAASFPNPQATDALSKATAGEHYAVLTDKSGNPLASAGDYSAGRPLALSNQVLARVARQAAASGTGVSYYIGDLVPYGNGYVSDFVVAFPAAGTTRMLVTGLDPRSPALNAFFGQDLKTVPGVKGEVNYIVDGGGRVVSASQDGVQAGLYPAHLGPLSPRRTSGDDHGSHFQSAQLANSGWRVLLVAPAGALFASVNGPRAYVPWIIFIALVVVALLAGLLAWRVIRSAEVVTDMNAKLAKANRDLSVANDSLHRRAAELARSNEELESFASIASHDLQEPLRKVRTFTQQLTVLEEERLSEKGRDYLTRANSAAERMQNLIEDLLKFSRVSTQGRPFEAVDLAELTARVLGDLERQVEEADAVVDVGPLPVITADPLQMQQLMQNLISNAIKFRRPGVPPVVTIRAEVRDGRMHLTVSDNGIGFEPRYAARIFRIFERLHGRSEYAGTGIGLALCRKIADRHGGTIEAESELGHGATFTVILPVTQADGAFGFGDSAPLDEEVHTGAAV